MNSEEYNALLLLLCCSSQIVVHVVFARDPGKEPLGESDSGRSPLYCVDFLYRGFADSETVLFSPLFRFDRPHERRSTTTAPQLAALTTARQVRHTLCVYGVSGRVLQLSTAAVDDGTWSRSYRTYRKLRLKIIWLQVGQCPF